MLLESLELQGFKTFPDKTKLTFDKGITSVVGPNGSGKSNISDAIRWVLGEQSPKKLRCTRMEDVVFNGTKTRKRQGFAEVTLTIDNKDRTLDFDEDKVHVTRRYYRSGESEYLLNKASVRLRDVHELFMDTGLGRDGYSMIGQGRIDDIVASRSEDRREIFEEAAGISRYRYKKTETERKLVRTEENLIRLRDIVAELEDRVEPLKKQSKKAEQFIKYMKEKEGLEIALWIETIKKSSSTLKSQEDKILICKNQYNSFNETVDNISKETENIYLENGNISSQIDEIRRKITEMDEEKSHKKAKVSVSENDILHNEENINRIKLEIENISKLSNNIGTEIEEKTKTIKNIKLEIEKARKTHSETSNKLNNITEDSGKSSDELDIINKNLNSLNSKASDYKVTQLTTISAISDLNSRINSFKKEKENKETILSDLKLMLKEYNESIISIEDKIKSLSNSVNGLNLKLKGKQEKKDNLREERDKLSLNYQERIRRAKLLEDLERNLEGFSRSVKIVHQNSEKGLLKGIHGPVSRVIEVPLKYTVAIETALGGAMQNIVTTTENDAKNAIELLKKKDGGRCTFLPLNTIKGRYLNERDLNNSYGFIGIAADLCTCDNEYKNILNSLLGRIVVAENLNSAISIAKKYGYRFRIVTLDGQVINAGGSLTGGSLGRKSGLLSRTTEIEESKEIAKKIQEDLNLTTSKLEKVAIEVKNLKDELQIFEDKIFNNKQSLVKVTAEQNACKKEITSTENTVTNLKADISNSKEKLNTTTITSEKATISLNDVMEKINEVENKVEEITGNKSVLAKKREVLSEKLQNEYLEIIKLEKDVESLNLEINLSKNTNKEQEEQKEQLNLQIEKATEQSTFIKDKISIANNEIEKLTISITENKDKILKLEVKKDELEKRVVKLRQDERTATSDREKISAELSRLEERKTNLKKEYDDIISKLWDEYELTLRQAEEVSIKIENLTEARKKLSQLKRQIKGLGNVNVAAIEEYKEVAERYEFMTEQVTDVEKSKQAIEDLIVDLTKQMQDVFIESFASINECFSVTFKELFGGGTASLKLSDPDDILTSGIDIIVHPPGKIVVHLEALSGGEKALVAIALYFAIMKVSPAPFCVMDEIEAALDEVNVDRFAAYLRTISDDTQFILITHRRGTMEEADVLYGVTMQDEGVSKMLELRASEAVEKLGIGKK